MLNSVLLFLEQTSVLHLEKANVLHSVPSGWISGANGDVNSSNCHGSGGHGSAGEVPRDAAVQDAEGGGGDAAGAREPRRDARAAARRRRALQPCVPPPDAGRSAPAACQLRLRRLEAE